MSVVVCLQLICSLSLIYSVVLRGELCIVCCNFLDIKENIVKWE